IDPVRFIGNYSSGKMGFALAAECAARGADVTLVAGPVALPLPHPAVTRIDVESAQQMHDAVVERFADADVAIMCAAVADYCVENVAQSKIKREKDDIPVIRLKKNPDIARAIGMMKRPGQITVGFALETDNEQFNAMDKLERKNLDFIVLNTLRDKGAGFKTDTNKVTIMRRNGVNSAGELKDKRLVARDIVDVLSKEYLNQ
ncbi:MAG: phosphopantothenoylcysteine decarboxylase, partial [Muribaculaceae bacterium]|nr:phosphopantothenoylcysteine decarboxylase [Muribaculaceae bacterium]